MADEIKPAGNEGNPPAGGNPPEPQPANQGPSAAELLKQKEELEKQLKEKDTKIADLETTKATIEARQRQIDEDKAKQSTNADLTARIKQINDRRAYDPDGADADMASLFAEVQAKAAKDAVTQASQVVSSQNVIGKLRANIKTSNPDFDDDIVDVIMERANALAVTGKFKTAEEAVAEATKFVKAKFDAYAQKLKAVPPLPPGANGEGGGNPPPTPPPVEKEINPQDEIQARQDAKQKKIL